MRASDWQPGDDGSGREINDYHTVAPAVGHICSPKRIEGYVVERLAGKLDLDGDELPGRVYR